MDGRVLEGPIGGLRFRDNHIIGHLVIMSHHQCLAQGELRMQPSRSHHGQAGSAPHPFHWAPGKVECNWC